MTRTNRGKLFSGMARLRAGFANQVLGVIGRPRLGDADWEELEDLLISSDVGPDFATGLVEQLRTAPVTSGDQLRELAREKLITALGRRDCTLPPPARPAVIVVVGVNGSGKTTTIAKLAARLQSDGHEVVLAAADTFRAGAIAQLQHWGARLNMRVVAQAPGSDPGSVAYDAASAAQASGADYLIVDTAGRLQNNAGLMRELEKICRVLGRRIAGAPHQKLIVLDGMSGLNGIAQAGQFAASIGLDGVVISKLDGSAKGGAAFMVAGELGLPIKFVGVGEGIDDLAEFDPEQFVDALLGERKSA